MDEHSCEGTVDYRADRAFGSNDVPLCLLAAIAVAEKAAGCGCIAFASSYAQQEVAQVFFAYGGCHCLDVISARMVQTQLVVGVPFSDVVKSEVVPEMLANLYKVVKVLLEEGGLMVGFRPGAEGIENDWGAVLGPMTEELSVGFDVIAFENATGDVFEFGFVDDYPSIRGGAFGCRGRGEAPAPQGLHQELAPCVAGMRVFFHTLCVLS